MAPEAFVLERDARQRIIVATVRGFWSPAIADEYVEAMGILMAQDRQSYGRAKALIDRRSSVVQTSETVERLRLGATRICQPADRMAIVVESALLKKQIRRSYDPGTVNLFLSMENAREWLSNT